MVQLEQNSRSLYVSPTASRMKVVLVLSLVLGCSSNVWSQPTQTNNRSTPTAKPINYKQRVDEFFKLQFGPLVKTDVDGAVGLAEQFLAANPQLKSSDLVRVYDSMAYHIYHFAPKSQKKENTIRALGILGEGRKQMEAREEPGVAQNLSRILTFTQTSILVNERRFVEARPLLEANWSVSSWDDGQVQRSFEMAQKIAVGLEAYAETTATLKPEDEETAAKFDSTALMKQALVTRLISRRQVEVPLFKILVTSLIEEKQYDQALSYTKLLFSLCSYNGEALQEATRLLASIYVAQGKVANLSLFARSQEDGGVENPLAAVALPVFPAELFEKELVRAQAFADKSRNSPARLGELITLRLAAGQYGPAMEVARQLWQADLSKAVGVEEVMRVFKAADQNLLRANAFLAYSKTQRVGTPQSEQGSPLREFFEQYPAQVQVPAQTPQ